jgi:hypothetical protein
MFTSYYSKLILKACVLSYLVSFVSRIHYWMRLFPDTNRTSHEIRIKLHRALRVAQWTLLPCIVDGTEHSCKSNHTLSRTCLYSSSRLLPRIRLKPRIFWSTTARSSFIPYKHMTAQIRNVRMKINRFSPHFSSRVFVKHMEFNNKLAYKYSKTCLKRNLRRPENFSAEARFPFNQGIL